MVALQSESLEVVEERLSGMGIEYDKEHVVENGIRVTQVSTCSMALHVSAILRHVSGFVSKPLTTSSPPPAQVFFHDPDRNMIEVGNIHV